MPVHLCVRVYSSGDAKETARDPEGLASWLEYNRLARPGNALFVDGACAEGDEGYLDRDAVDVVARQLAAEAAVGSASSAARPVNGRYPDDRPRRGFRFGIPATPPAA